jgi:hypothetical protein
MRHPVRTMRARWALAAALALALFASTYDPATAAPRGRCSCVCTADECGGSSCSTRVFTKKLATSEGCDARKGRRCLIHLNAYIHQWGTFTSCSWEGPRGQTEEAPSPAPPQGSESAPKPKKPSPRGVTPPGN